MWHFENVIILLRSVDMEYIEQMFENKLTMMLEVFPMFMAIKS